MKKLILLTLAVAGISFAHAQKVSENKVPQVVKATLHKLYPNVTGVKWEKENGNYEAGFEAKKTNYSVLINASGEITETEIEISIDALPSNIKDYISKNNVGKVIKEAAKITDAKGIITYEAEIDGKDLIFDNSGKFLKEVKD